jgi:hypothetical protein
MQDSTSTEIEDGEPPNQPPDKFKVPLPKHKSAFQPIPKREANIATGAPSRGSGKINKTLVYDYILKKACGNKSDITEDEMMILRSHPVIAELIKQAGERRDLSKFSYYIPVDSIINYSYNHNTKIPILFDSREK